MASVQTIKLGNISVTVSVETAPSSAYPTTPTRVSPILVTPMAPVKAPQPLSSEELLFNRVAQRLRVSLTPIPGYYSIPSYKDYNDKHGSCWCKRYGSHKFSGVVYDIEMYLSHFRLYFAEGAYEIQEKRELFRTVMKNNSKDFDEDIFQVYLEYAKTTPRKYGDNRYKRMDSFIKSL
jgi:hypothetical protein